MTRIRPRSPFARETLARPLKVVLMAFLPFFGGTPFDRLLRGRSLSAADGPTFEGRLDLRNQAAPEPRFSPGPTAGVERVQSVQLKKVRWSKLDLSRSTLRAFRFHDALLEDCLLDGANCMDWRLWGTTVRDCSFRGANLRDAALGGVSDGARNRYERVDFSQADLRGTAYLSCEFDQCDFAGARLDNVEFEGSVFTRCRFAGELSGTIFSRHGFRAERFPPNEMDGVDFSDARFRFVEFRELELKSVRWPTSEEHIAVHDVARTLERIIRALDSRTDDASRALAAGFSQRLRWTSPNQQTGVISRDDIREMGDPSLVQLVEELAHQEAPRQG